MYLFSVVVCLSILCLLVLIINRKSLAAPTPDPNFYYYSGGRKIELPLSKEMVAVRFEQGVSLEQQRSIVDYEKHLGMFSQRKDLSIFELTLLPLREGVAEGNITEIINGLNGKSGVRFANPVFDFPDANLILTDEFIVKFAGGVSDLEIDAFNTLNDVEIVRKPEWTERYTLRVKDATNFNTLRTANLYYESPITIFSMPNFIRILKVAAVTPDDLYFSEQWCLNNTGQTGGTDNADIDAPERWDIHTGSSEIIVAVIDTGVDYEHEDLAANMWINPGEDQEPFGVITEDDWNENDDDGNGYEDDICGWDFFNMRRHLATIANI